VSCKTTEENTNRDRLRARYRGAFGEWALQVNRLQAIVSSQSDTSVVREAEERAVSAETAYRQTRDRLTEDLAQGSGRASHCH
jgi:hypothetical protein